MKRYWRLAIHRSRDFHGISQVAPRTRHKTGWFYDQRDNSTSGRGWIIHCIQVIPEAGYLKVIFARVQPA